jgi:hypothetical protein
VLGGDEAESLVEAEAGGDADKGTAAPSVAAPATPAADSSEDRLDRIERELQSLRGELASLREALGES